MKKIAELIIAGIEKNGFTKSTFALLMNIQPSVVTKWLSGKHNFTVETLFKIEDVLGIKIFNLTQPKTIRLTQTVVGKPIVIGPNCA